jgi:hypothetical protein
MKKIYCPINGWDCPYWKEDGSCSMVDEGNDPVAECDDAAAFCGIDEDYLVWVDENGATYDVDELLELGYHFINGEPVLGPAPPLDEKLKFLTMTLNEILHSWDEEISFPPDFDEMGSNGFRG